MLSAAFDFLGEMIEQAYQIYVRKNVNVGNTEYPPSMKESFSMDEYSIQGSYNSEEMVPSSIKKR